ncbi:ABC transporter permease [Peribacillus sp. NPDC096379]|uniref:ABC transporter permease n=1 Tax=Peribacillus sp. NPDC096379 TaxID=3364393 RepID=UPI0037F243D1
MKKIWALCMWEIKMVFSNRRNYLVMFAMPLVFTLLFGHLFTTDEEPVQRVLVVDQDQSMLSSSFVTAMVEDQRLFQVEQESKTVALSQLKEKTTPVVLTIDKGFEEEMNAKIPVLSLQRVPEFTGSEVLTEFIANKLAETRIRAVASKEWSKLTGENWETMFTKLRDDAKEATVSKKTTLEINQHSQDSLSRSASGFSIMFLMISVLSVTGTILEARTNGVWQRLMIMPASRTEIAVGYLLSFFLIGWIQFGVLILTTHFLFDVSWGNPFYLLILLSALILAIVGLGLLIATTVKTIEQQSMLSNLLVISTCMIAGVYWPLEIEPVFMQKMAEFLPQTWAMRGIEEIASGSTFFAILDNVGILLLFGCVFLLLGIRKIKF